jgi:putative membrane protein
MNKFKVLSVALALLGVIGATLLVGMYGFDRVAGAILSVGFGGFALFCLWQIVVMAIVGVAWRVVAPLQGKRLTLIFIWGRMIRDSAGVCLPFSAVGGFLLGARAVTLHGVSWSVSAISTIVDLTAEFAAEIIFTLGGFLILVNRTSDPAIAHPAEIGAAVALVGGIVVLRMQRGIAPLFIKLGRRLLGQWFRDGERDGVSSVELAKMYGNGSRLALCTFIHVLGWFGKGFGNWIAFRLLGADIDIAAAMAIEGILHVALAMAVLIPGYAGVQEAGYVGLGALFGVAPEVALGASLIRRARDIAIGIPILLVWQFFEVRRLRTSAPSGSTSASS